MLTRSSPLGNAWSDTRTRLEDERALLRRIHEGEPLVRVLERLLAMIEAQSSVPLRTSVLLADGAGRFSSGVGPSLPAAHLAAFSGASISPALGPWGQAGSSGEPAYVVDIPQHPEWQSWYESLRPLGLQSCWSTPIKSPDGALLGVFSNYYACNLLPSQHNLDAVALVAHTIGLAMERHRTEHELLRSARRWRSMFAGMREGFFLAEAVRSDGGAVADFRLLEVNPAFQSQCACCDGVCDGNCVGRSLREVLRQIPSRIIDMFVGVAETGEPAQAEYSIPGPPPAWYEARSRQEGSDRIIVLLLDVSARKIVEAELLEDQRHKAFQLSLGDQLRMLNEPQKVEDATCEALGQHLALDSVCVLRLAKDDGTLETTAHWPHGDDAQAPLADALAAIREAVKGDVALPLRQLEGSGQDGLIVPLGHWGRFHTALVARTADARPLSRLECETVENTAERLCNALERCQHALQLQERVEQAIAERDRVWRLSPDILGLMDAGAQFLSVSPATRAILGWTPERFIAMGFSALVHPEDQPATRAIVNQALSGEGTGLFHMENRMRRHGGGYCWIHWTMSSAMGHLYLVGRDETLIKEQARVLTEAEAALRQSQKLEAVGRLTSGIAHDFNNMLQGITGSLYMMERKLAGQDFEGVRRYITLAGKACGRAGQLTRRLLTFSRRQPVDPQPCDPGDVLLSMKDLFRRYTGERIALRFDLSPNIWPVRCDVNQLESVLLNLVINACDAIEASGTIVLSTRNVRIQGPGSDTAPELPAGNYVEIAVSDNGSGMAPDVLAQVFEPFFTTKPTGAGSGLGLPMGYGFAQQARGTLVVRSAAGEGTTVRLVLPRHVGHRSMETLRLAADVGLQDDDVHDAVVLVVEDDQTVREMAAETIAGLGVTVLTAVDGPGGIQQVADASRLDLLITDIGLPGLDGPELAARACKLYPDLSVLFMTGYLQDPSGNPVLRGPGMDYIIKPFTLEALAMRVRHMLAEHNRLHSPHIPTSAS